MRITFSWDDGAPEDLKLMELHRKYEIPGMFFVPTENREGRPVLTKAEINRNASELIQFGGHTQHHTYLTSIPIDSVASEVSANKAFLEDVLGKEIKHFCLPGGKYDQEILKIIFQQYETCRTADTMSIVSDNQLLIPTFHFYPRGIKSLVGNAVRQKNISMGLNVLTHVKMEYFELLKYLTEQANSIRESRVIIWGHSWEIDELGLWNELDDYMAYVKERYSDQIVSYDSMLK